jgi:hypothetical protein
LALVGSESQVPGYFAVRKEVTEFIGVWMGPTADLDFVENRI